MNNREYQEILENLLHRIDLLEKQLKKFFETLMV